MAVASGPARAVRRARHLSAALLLLGMALAGCGAREHSNPLDPLNPETHGLLPAFVALASDHRVDLSWEPLLLSPAPSVQIERLGPGDSDFHILATVPISDAAYTDSMLANGADFVYRARVLSASGSLSLAAVDTAAPGPEVTWIADTGRARLLALTPDARAFSLDLENYESPRSIMLDPIAQRLWVANTFTGAIQAGLVELGLDGQELGYHAALQNPDLLALDPLRGGGWVADSHSGTLARFGPDGNVQAGARSFVGIAALAVDGSDGSVWVAEKDSHRLTHVRANGIRIASWNQFENPSCLAVDPGSAPGSKPGVWMGDQDAGILYRLSPDGRVIHAYAGFDGIQALAVDAASGTLYAAGSGFLERLDADGRVRWQVAGPASVAALSINPVDLSVWLADPQGNAVWKAGPEGFPMRRKGGFSFPLGVAVDPGPRILARMNHATLVSR